MTMTTKITAGAISTLELDPNAIVANPITTGRLTLSPEARDTLAATGLVWNALEDRPPNEAEWCEIEDALLEILTDGFRQRYITGVTHDRCTRCHIRSRYAGDFLCTDCRTQGDPS